MGTKWVQNSRQSWQHQTRGSVPIWDNTRLGRRKTPMDSPRADGVAGAWASPASRPSSPSLKRREYGEGCVLGEYLWNQVDPRADSAGEPVAVAVDGLDAALLVDRADAVPGLDRVGDDVPAIDDREAMADKERGPVGDQLGPAVVQDGSQRLVLLPRRAGAQGQVGEADVPAWAKHPVKVAHEPVLVPLGDADVAGGLQADDGVEPAVGEVECPHVAPHDPYPVRHAPLLDQPPSLAHLLAADVDPGDLAAVAIGDAQRRRPDATARIKHELPRLQACHLTDQVGVRVERLRQRLATRAEVTKMEVVTVEQARLVGDQVEVRADAGRASSSPHQDRQRQPDRRRQLACGT